MIDKKHMLLPAHVRHYPQIVAVVQANQHEVEQIDRVLLGLEMARHAQDSNQPEVFGGTHHATILIVYQDGATQALTFLGPLVVE